MNQRMIGRAALILSVLLVLSGCTNNIFSAFDEPDPGPSASDLRAQYDATGNPVGTMELAAEAGAVTITGNSNSLAMVNNFAAVITTLQEQENPDPEDVLSALIPDFPDTPAGKEAFTAMITTFQQAADDYETFATAYGNAGGVDPLNSGEKGDLVQMALISLVVDAAVTATNVDTLWDLANGRASETEFSGDDPLADLNDSGTAVFKVLEYAGLETTF